MRLALLVVIGMLLAGCNTMKPVDGVPEVILNDDFGYVVSTQQDGRRLITISQGERVVSVILLSEVKKPNSTVEVEKK